MPNEEFVMPQASLNELTKLANRLQAGIFRSTSLFKRQPRTRQLVIQPVLEADSKIIVEAVQKIFPAERISIEKDWRRIVINLENVTFTS